MILHCLGSRCWSFWWKRILLMLFMAKLPLAPLSCRFLIWFLASCASISFMPFVTHLIDLNLKGHPLLLFSLKTLLFARTVLLACCLHCFQFSVELLVFYKEWYPSLSCMVQIFAIYHVRLTHFSLFLTGSYGCISLNVSIFYVVWHGFLWDLDALAY